MNAEATPAAQPVTPRARLPDRRRGHWNYNGEEDPLRARKSAAD